ncbi:IS66 family insertion sequence element accessory protein TnpB [Alteribacillus sp. JSM 102045]|uniref:IS66 family insertion sequence element accessory protein TnpA n=1 Tax=Alteribacillus sp. JSM 102045 TaxID=1562101 RepID=UPI0035C050D6
MDRSEHIKIWEKRIAEFKASGLSVPKWCAEQDGISVPQMRYWLRKLKNIRKETDTSSTSAWMTVEVNESFSLSNDSLHIHVGSATIEVKSGFDPVLLSDVIKVLKASC